MRKLVASMFVSLDGVMEDPGGAEKTKHGGWTMPYWNGEIGKFKLDELFESDALLLGRVTYQGFAAAWPSRTDKQGFAERMNSIPNYVVSTTLEEVEWNNSRLIKGNVVEEVSKLEQLPGQNILIAGSGELVHTLMKHDLIDEYRLLVSCCFGKRKASLQRREQCDPETRRNKDVHFWSRSPSLPA